MPSRFDPFAPSSEKVHTVSELTGRVRALLEKTGPIRVAGEVSGLRRAASGHAYFQLKDERAALDAVLFRGAIARLPSGLPDDGSQVECLGRLTMYEPRGRTQLIVEWLSARGEGELARRMQLLKERLEAEGLFDPAAKRPLPLLPRCVGIVTSPTGAAVRDMLKVLGRRFPSVPVLICPVRVQGDSAAGEIAAGITRLAASGRVDVIIAGRGGGSLEDLWAFNEEVVVRAVAACPVPLVSAVGHETDWVLSDLAADVRAATPSVAAELVVPDAAELRRSFALRARSMARALRLTTSQAGARLRRCTARMRDPRLVVAAHRQRLDEAARGLVEQTSRRVTGGRARLSELRVRLATFEPRARLAGLRQRLGALRGRLAAAARATVAARRLELEVRRRGLSGLSPLSVLDRGYSLVSTPDGRLVRDAGSVPAGTDLKVRPARGQLRARVLGIDPSDDEKR